MREYLTQTHRERMGGIDGVNLFFGALLGANLGTVEQLPLGDYVQLIVILAGTVVTLRLVSTSDRRGYALASLGLYIFLVGVYLAVPHLRPEGLSPAAAARLGATLAVWILLVLTLEYWPVRPDEVRPAEPPAPVEAAAPPSR
ncbi:MAG TPA: hypothetical protein VK472_04790 [Allosphingosinicella sp.]|nr:hypothetical protein [Allosphingosinicella sp.]